MNDNPLDTRPDPDSLLQALKKEEEKAANAKLKIFFGMCAGVGKTYDMPGAAEDHRIHSQARVLQQIERHIAERFDSRHLFFDEGDGGFTLMSPGGVLAGHQLMLDIGVADHHPQIGIVQRHLAGRVVPAIQEQGVPFLAHG